MSAMLNSVLIYGSCVSRDIFNFEEASAVKITDYYARSSIASLARAPYENDIALGRITSEFRRRMVARDFSNDFLTETEKISAADCILLDLIDERFDLVALTTGEIVTHSAELAESGLLQDSSVEGFKRCRTRPLNE